MMIYMLCRQKSVSECRQLFFNKLLLTIYIKMGYKYESLPVRKDRYTLLLESPFLIMLKSKMAVFMEGLFRYYITQ